MKTRKNKCFKLSPENRESRNGLHKKIILKGAGVNSQCFQMDTAKK